MILIQEHYKNYDPPNAVKKSIERMATTIPTALTTGLHSIILTNSQALNRKDKRSKVWAKQKKYSLKDCRGMYYQKWHNEPAYIQIIIDNIILDYPNWVFMSRFATDIILAETLFHEIGHHIHHAQAPEYKNKEDLAHKWQMELSKSYFKKKYRLIIALLQPFKGTIKWLQSKTN